VSYLSGARFESGPFSDAGRPEARRRPRSPRTDRGAVRRATSPAVRAGLAIAVFAGVLAGPPRASFAAPAAPASTPASAGAGAQKAIARPGPAPTAPGVKAEAGSAEAKALYESTCVSCHGAEGRGDGLAAVGLPAKPATFASAAWQSATSDEEIARAIVGGGAAVGKSPLMPPNPQLADKPAVVAALRSLIRSFAHTASPVQR